VIKSQSLKLHQRLIKNGKIFLNYLVTNSGYVKVLKGYLYKNTRCIFLFFTHAKELGLRVATVFSNLQRYSIFDHSEIELMRSETSRELVSVEWIYKRQLTQFKDKYKQFDFLHPVCNEKSAQPQLCLHSVGTSLGLEGEPSKLGINEERLLVNVPGLHKYESSRGVKPIPSMQVKAFRNVIISDKRLQLRRREGTMSQELQQKIVK
jgi:hypothetical protein